MYCKRVEREIPETGRPSKSVTAMRRSSLDFLLYLIMPNLKLTHDEVNLLNDMFSTIASLGLYDDPSENEQDSSPDVFDKLWDKVTKL